MSPADSSTMSPGTSGLERHLPLLPVAHHGRRVADHRLELLRRVVGAHLLDEAQPDAEHHHHEDDQRRPQVSGQEGQRCQRQEQQDEGVLQPGQETNAGRTGGAPRRSGWGPTCARRACASVCVSPSGDDPSFANRSRPSTPAKSSAGGGRGLPLRPARVDGINGTCRVSPGVPIRVPSRYSPVSRGHAGWRATRRPGPAGLQGGRGPRPRPPAQASRHPPRWPRYLATRTATTTAKIATSNA